MTSPQPISRRIRALEPGAKPVSGIERRVEKLTSILEISKSIAAERDLDRLLGLVVNEASEIVECERSSLFLYDRDRDELWSRVAEGAPQIRFPASSGIAGAALRTGQTINIPDAYADPRFNREVDQRTGFVTRSILAVPMRNRSGDIVGALQSLNKTGPDGTPAVFTGEDEELLLGLAGISAAAVTNAVLLEEIQRLFEGFARAAVVAIESRDPTTAGHSDRVAVSSVGLAQAVERAGVGRWRGLSFTRDQMQELRYAALLHDFGKVGVREHVLVKAEKLYPSDIREVDERFESIRSAAIIESGRRKLDIALAGGADRDARLATEDARLAARLDEIEGMLAFVRAANRPTVLPEGSFERLLEIQGTQFEDSRGQRRPFLTDRETQLLSTRQGSLTAEERKEIESHAVHTYNFLSQIPWTRALRNVPEIAYRHHEKLSGKGYPLGLGETEIPVQTRMITISDIYDALTADDRPYKRSLPHARALDILQAEAKEGNIDADLVQVFIEADVAQKNPRAG